MEVFRLVRERYASPLSGKGAAIKGARWNSAGVELIYTAQNRSLAMAEVAVHFTFATLPDDYIMLTIHVPEDISFLEITPKELPAEWRDFPHPMNTQRIGDKFVAENRQCIMIIPSVITQCDFNVLINPNHPEFKRIRVISTEKFPIDKRLFK